MTELGVKLAEEIHRRGVSKRQAAREIGIAHTSVNEITKGRPVDFLAAYRISKWMNEPFASTLSSVSPSNFVVGAVLGVLQKYPEMREFFTQIDRERRAGARLPEDFEFLLDLVLLKIQRGDI